MKKFIVNQRWVSDLELNLGLGIVRAIKDRRVEIHYPASDCVRLYAMDSAPLRRVIFKPGDTIESREGSTFVVDFVESKDGLLTYFGKNSECSEKDLKDSLNFTSPEDRVNSQLFDDTHEFNLRYQALHIQNEIRRSPVRGFIGGRIDLIPHQLYTAHEVSSRSIPRVLLSDETGLGKTIEACLILHRLLLNEQIQRVLILVPDSLVHQWFVELLRKFNLIFKIVDQETLFLDDQCFLCNISMLTQNDILQKSALQAEWDMIIVDEAHHLVENSPEYLLVKKLGEKSNGLLLLTATPEQFGFQSHFARLHLLDPARYFSYEMFQKEENHYLEVANIVDKLVKKEPLSDLETGLLRSDSLKDFKDSPIPVMEELLDRLGTGRAIFQNSRSVMKGFPERKVHLIPLKAGADDLTSQTLEFNSDQKTIPEIEFDFTNEKRIYWLIALLKKPDRKKILLICHSKEKARAVAESLRNAISIEIVLFHEDLTLLQRDQNASRFADENGAQILICSEIGSEGRNFQFAHHLVLFDLPLNPELLEQRIGRLDRIGQKESIHIHVPYYIGSEYEILARWYHEGLNSFNQNIPGIHVIFHAFESTLREIISQNNSNNAEERLSKLIQETKIYRDETVEKFKQGKDHLLELNSHRPEVAKELIREIENADRFKFSEEWMLDIFETYGIEEDFISDKTYRLNLALLTNEEFPLPVLKRDNLVITFDRNTAVTNEHMEFITWDHPLVTSVLEFHLGSEKGNCSLASLKNSQKQMILLETVFVLECVAPKGLLIDRFLPPTPIRFITNHFLENSESVYTREFLLRNLRSLFKAKILNNPQFKQELFPAMMKKSKEIVNEKSEAIRKNSLTQMEKIYEVEINRLVKLQKINPHIQRKEIDDRVAQKELLRKTILESRLRLDSLRLIFSQDLAG